MYELILRTVLNDEWIRAVLLNRPRADQNYDIPYIADDFTSFIEILPGWMCSGSG
ncbi:hypothetical protein GLW04_05430 [Halobacillus litoralis]|uniref:Uncharacterized protein n=1 Tax=Halobacillus litoralis TaxID=45668 RepID=A0A845DPH1_9BACI|nr:hypothetical protein [Halobacillus litoralis]MYL28467.1 hypothetical protein [Halobacillus halophilus]MYL38101.1 hypothetical protein [Halobacillus litoralis]